MYCQHCGAESTQGLNYCNRCGGNLGALAQGRRRESADGGGVSAGRMWAAGGTLLLLVVLGFGVLGAMLTDFVHNGMRPEPLVMMMMCGSLTILLSVYMLTRFWMRLLLPGKHESAEQQTRLYAPPTHTNELGAPQRFGALPDSPVPSVTEHTTRTLEHAKKR